MKFAKELSPVALNGAISGEITICFEEKIVQSSYYFESALMVLILKTLQHI